MKLIKSIAHTIGLVAVIALVVVVCAGVDRTDSEPPDVLPSPVHCDECAKYLHSTWHLYPDE